MTVIARSITNLSGNKTFASNISIPNNCTITNNGTILLTGTISGLGGIFHTGTGTTTLNNSTSYSGFTNIRSGTFKIGNSGNLGNGLYNGTMFINGALDYSSATDQVITGNVGNYRFLSTAPYNPNSKLIINGPGTFHIRSRFGDFQFDGTLEINGGKFRVGNNDLNPTSNGAHTGTGSIAAIRNIFVNTNGTLEFNRNNSSSQANVNAAITGNGPINIIGGSYAFAGAGDGGNYSGVLDVSSGSIWNTARAMPNASFVNNGTLTLNVGSLWRDNYVWTVTVYGNTTNTIYGTDYIIGSSIGAANITAQIQSAGLGNSASDFTGFVPGRIALVERGVQPFQTKVTNAIAAGAVAVIIYNNTTGLTTPSVVTDIPVIMITQSLGQQLVTALSTETVTSRIDTLAFATPFSNPVTGNGTIIKSGDSPLIVSLGSGFTGTVSVTGGTLRALNSNSFGGATSLRASTGTYEILGGSNISNPFSLSGTGVSSGGSIRSVSGNNTLSSAISLLAASRINSDSGTLTLSSSGTLTGTFGLTLGGAGNISVQRPIATSTSTLTKDGAGTAVLSAANTYTGVTTISGGTLRFTTVSSLYNGTTASWTRTNIIVNNGATFALNVGGTNEFTTTNVGTLLTNLLTTINNNGLRSGSSIGFDTTNSPSDFTISSNITDSAGTGAGAVGVVKLGTGTLVLSGTSNTYTGGTTINGGTLRAGNATCFGTGTITLNSGATLDLAGFTITNTVINNGGTIIN